MKHGRHIPHAALLYEVNQLHKRNGSEVSRMAKRALRLGLDAVMAARRAMRGGIMSNVTGNVDNTCEWPCSDD